MKSFWKEWIIENGSYKLVALFVTLILWVTILGRRDFVLTKEMDLEFLLPHNVQITEGVTRVVSVKVSGPRLALKKFAQNPGVITVDLGRMSVGRSKVTIPPKSVDVPFGVKVVSITPEVIDAQLTLTTKTEGAKDVGNSHE